jgi:hypothetical protein
MKCPKCKFRNLRKAESCIERYETMKNRDTKSKSVARGGEGSREAGILAETLTGEQGGCLLSFSVMLHWRY